MAVLNRVKQFYHALFSKVKPEDLAFVKQNLDNQELSLFMGMDRPTQTHCLRVARTALKLLPQYGPLNKQLLIKAALLHDIGKPPDVIKTFDRVFIVLLIKFAPEVIKKILTDTTNYGHFQDALFTHIEHPRLGAAIAMKYHLPEALILLISNHHKEESPNDSMELVLLRKADNLN